MKTQQEIQLREIICIWHDERVNYFSGDDLVSTASEMVKNAYRALRVAR